MRHLCAALALAALATWASAQQTIPSPASLEAMGRWERHCWERIEQFREENGALDRSETSRNVILLGSSSMEGWKHGERIDRFLPGLRVLNRGITADRIGIGERGILHRLDDSVFDCNPSHVFLLNGRNDLGSTMRTGSPAVEDVATVYEEVVSTIQAQRPDVVVCIVTCTPVNLRYEPMAPLVVEFNDHLRRIATEHGCPLIDLHAPLVGDDGLIPAAVSSDGLHFNTTGYEIFGREIVRAVSETP